MKQLIFVVPAALGVFSSAVLLKEPSGKAAFQNHRRPAIVTKYVPHRFSEEKVAEIKKDHCPLGMPALTPHPAYGPTRILDYKGYVVELSMRDKIPIWVCEQVSSEDLVGDAKRAHSFKQDKAFKKSLQGTHKDYTNSGYARGHLAAAANRNSNQELKTETFLTNNIVPQHSPMNSGRWRSLETKSRDWVDRERPVFITTGPLFFDEAENDEKTADGFIEHRTIGQGGVSVPSILYKVILQRRPDDQTKWRAIGFAMPNMKPDRPDLESYIVSIRWIEQQLSVNFFPEHDDDAEWQKMEEEEQEMW